MQSRRRRAGAAELPHGSGGQGRQEELTPPRKEAGGGGLHSPAHTTHGRTPARHQPNQHINYGTYLRVSAGILSAARGVHQSSTLCYCLSTMLGLRYIKVCMAPSSTPTPTLWPQQPPRLGMCQPTNKPCKATAGTSAHGCGPFPQPWHAQHTHTQPRPRNSAVPATHPNSECCCARKCVQHTQLRQRRVAALLL